VAINHTVEQGEHILRIAEKYHFFDYTIIWDDGANAAIKTKRDNPNVLNPGDVVVIPDKTPKKETRPTTKVHTFKVNLKPLRLWIEIHNYDGEMAAGVECVLKVEAKETKLTTPRGFVHKYILVDDQDGHLKVEILNIDTAIKIGYLDPVEEPTGQHARLNNLGYNAGTVGDPDPDQLKSAVEEFQCDNELPVTGVCDAATQSKLKELHLC
jgi:hypothetical protein